MRYICTSIVATLALAGSAIAETHTVLANNTTFAPDAIDVAPGDTIVWQYNSGYPHTVTSGVPCTADGLFHGELQNGGDTFTWDVPADASGNISYFCEPHCAMGMTGVITVVGPAVLNVPADYPTIASAIDAASNGDTIAIAAGTYYEHDLTIGEGAETVHLSIIGETLADGMPAVTIDALQQGRVISVGGGAYGNTTSEYYFANLVITGGAYVPVGGGISSSYGLTLENCTVTNNMAIVQGGGIWNTGSKGDTRTHPVINACRFIGNSSPKGKGGAIGIFYSEATLSDCIFSENDADEGGAIYIYSLTSAELNDCVVCGNTSDDGNQIVGEWTDLGGTCESPLCADDDGDGVPETCATDDDGVLHVPGEYLSITEALLTAVDDNTVLIAAGTYAASSPLDTAGLAITIRGETNADGSPATIIDGAGGDQGVFHCENGEGPDTVFENLHITNGYSGLGGGMFVLEASPTLNNCVFSGNASAYLGGAIYCEGGSPTFTDCKFSNNEANLIDYYYSYGGGAIANAPLFGSSIAGHLTFIDCAFEDNIANGGSLASGGGAITMSASSMTLTNCSVTGNTGVTAGGIVYSESGSTAFTMAGTTVCGNAPDQIYGAWTDNGGNTVADECPNDCTGDLDGNGEVGVDDLLAVLAAYQTNADGDCDGDGDTDVDDLLLLISAWGPCP